jgi:hypothetical protein
MAAADQDSPDLRALLRAELAAAEAKAAVLREYLGEEANDAASVVTSACDFKARTGHSPRTVVEAIRAGDLPATKVTRGYRVTLADLRTWELTRTAARRARRSERLPPRPVDAAREIDRVLANAVRTKRRGQSVRSMPPRGGSDTRLASSPPGRRRR